MDIVKSPSIQGSSKGRHWFSYQTAGSVLTYCLFAIFIISVLFPFWWVIRTALTDPSRVFTDTSSLTPVDATTQNFERVLGLIDANDLVGEHVTNANHSTATLNFWIFLRNSVIVALAITLGKTLFSTMSTASIYCSNRNN
jgi:multiple sugar transport system permease protein